MQIRLDQLWLSHQKRKARLLIIGRLKRAKRARRPAARFDFLRNTYHTDYKPKDTDARTVRGSP